MNIRQARRLSEARLARAWRTVAEQATHNADAIGTEGFDPARALSDFARRGTDNIREATEILAAIRNGDWRDI